MHVECRMQSSAHGAHDCESTVERGDCRPRDCRRTIPYAQPEQRQASQSPGQMITGPVVELLLLDVAASSLSVSCGCGCQGVRAAFPLPVSLLNALAFALHVPSPPQTCGHSVGRCCMPQLHDALPHSSLTFSQSLPHRFHTEVILHQPTASPLSHAVSTLHSHERTPCSLQDRVADGSCRLLEPAAPKLQTGIFSLQLWCECALSSRDHPGATLLSESVAE